MKIIQARNYKELSKISSDIIIEEIKNKPNLTLGFATGKTPLQTYKNLVNAYKNKKVDFSKVNTFNLDEFYPIKSTNKKSYSYYMCNNLFNKANFQKKNINLLNGETKYPEKESKDYEAKIKKHPIDLQILGIGLNGHIGFNEPNTPPNSKTHLTELTHTKGKALTMGISTILKSKKLLLLASGKKKAKIIKKLIKYKPNEDLPASFIKTHKNLTIILDKKAGSLL